MVSVTSASRYHPHYQSRSSMYIRGLIQLNFAELAEAVPIATTCVNVYLRMNRLYMDFYAFEPLCYLWKFYDKYFS